jgi:hypothetical protein
MITLRVVMFAATFTGLGMLAHMLTGCTELRSNQLTSSGRLEHTKMPNGDYSVTLISGMWMPGVDYHDPATRMTLARRALACPNGRLINETSRERPGAIRTETVYEMTVRC